MSQRGKRRILRVLLLILAGSAALCVAEGALRLWQARTGSDPPPLPSPDRIQIGSRFMPDPFTTYRLRPGYEKTGYSVNSAGFRGEEPPRPKPTGVLRLAFVGGSTTEQGPTNELTYPAQAVALLRKRHESLRFDHINAGVPGFTSHENLIQFAIRVLDFEPDIVVIHQGINDVPPRCAPDFRSDYGHFRSSWTGPTNPTWADRLYMKTEGWLGWSALYARATGWLLAGCGTGGKPIQAFTVRPEARGSESMPGPLYPETMKALERNTRALIALCRSFGAHPILTTQPFQIDTEAISPVDRYEPHSSERNRNRHYYQGIREHNDLMRRLSSELNVPLADLAALTREKALYLDMVHMNAQGLKRKSSRVVKRIEESGLLPLD